MTVIAAVREHDTALLIAADTGGEEMPGHIPISIPDKLKKHPTAPLAWGTAGNPTIGEEFTDWLQDYVWPASDWRTFWDQAIDKLSRLNGRQRELNALAKVETKESDVTAALVVGWLNDDPHIIELDENGKATSYITDGFHAIGTGKPHAYIAHRTLQAFPDVPPIDRFSRLATVAAIMAPQSQSPTVIWRVTPGGVEKVDA